MPRWLNQKLHMNKGLHGRYRKKYVFTWHHVSHAASAFYPSPYNEAAILTIDGVSEWATCSFGIGRGNRIELYGELALSPLPLDCSTRRSPISSASESMVTNTS